MDDVDNGIAFVYGYLVDATCTFQYALAHSPFFQRKLKEDGFHNVCNPMIRFSERKIRKESGLRELKIQTVWIGAGTLGYCWILSERFRRPDLPEEEKRSLNKFKKLACVHGDPMLYAHTDGIEPEFMQHMQRLTPSVSPLTVGTFEHRLNTGEITVDSLVASYKLENLTLGDGTDDSEGSLPPQIIQ